MSSLATLIKYIRMFREGMTATDCLILAVALCIGAIGVCLVLLGLLCASGMGVI